MKRMEFMVKFFGRWHIAHQLVTSETVINEDGSKARPERWSHWWERDGTPICPACENDECIPLTELDRLGVAELNSRIRARPPRGRIAKTNTIKFSLYREKKKRKK